MEVGEPLLRHLAHERIGAIRLHEMAFLGERGQGLLHLISEGCARLGQILNEEVSDRRVVGYDAYVTASLPQLVHHEDRRSDPEAQIALRSAPTQAFNGLIAIPSEHATLQHALD